MDEDVAGIIRARPVLKILRVGADECGAIMRVSDENFIPVAVAVALGGEDCERLGALGLRLGIIEIIIVVNLFFVHGSGLGLE